MFHKEFYPTPESVIDTMQIDCKGKTVLEPQAGKGDIVKWLIDNGARDVFCYEINKDLQKIVQSKATLLGSDFLQARPEDISHCQLIVMNPPFSNASQHIEHAFEIAADGCEIISLCNYETINKTMRYRRLSVLIRDHGLSQNLGSCFDTAERKTGVEVGLVRLFKPTANKNGEFEGFFMDEDEDVDGQGIERYNEVKALVNRYVGAIKAFDKLQDMKQEVEQYLKPIGISEITFNVGYNNKISSRDQFAKDLQKRSWSFIFSKMSMNKYVTSGVMKDINSFVEAQQKYPFTMKNIYRMFEIIVGTRQQTYNRALEEAVDNFTRHTKENRFGVEGWKTNSGFMLNKKFIINWMVEQSYSGGLSLRFGSNEARIEDLIKVLCNILGTNYDTVKPLRRFFNDNNGLERGRWYHWEFFDIKVFNKGTMHLKFRSEEHWYRLNKAYGELKGFVLHDSYKN